MANVFGIITAIFLAISAFVAYQNQNAYKREIATTLDEKDKLAKSQARLKLARNTLAATLAERQEIDTDNVRLTAMEVDQKKANAELETQKSEKTAKTATNKEQLDSIRDKTAKIGDLKQLASKMRATNAELEELSQSISAAEAKLANLTALNTQAEAHSATMNKKFETIRSGQSLPMLNTRIRSIYPTWGFVTLAAGNNGGVVTNSTLDVVRGGETIAKLLVTAVETNSASASIIPDSIGSDVTLMAGDKVIPAQKPALPIQN